jgi:hypothetical protein
MRIRLRTWASQKTTVVIDEQREVSGRMRKCFPGNDDRQHQIVPYTNPPPLAQLPAAKTQQTGTPSSLFTQNTPSLSE